MADIQDIKRGRLTPDEVAELERLADRGLNSGQIALKMNRHPGTIGFRMATSGYRAMKAAPESAIEYRRGASTVRRFSRDEDAFIQALRVQDYSTTEIAKISGQRFGHIRSAATILARLKMLAGREDLAP